VEHGPALGSLVHDRCVDARASDTRLRSASEAGDAGAAAPKAA
jgi:hypothetical protein